MFDKRIEEDFVLMMSTLYENADKDFQALEFTL